jgi:hypothetical protein
MLASSLHSCTGTRASVVKLPFTWKPARKTHTGRTEIACSMKEETKKLRGDRAVRLMPRVVSCACVGVQFLRRGEGSGEFSEIKVGECVEIDAEAKGYGGRKPEESGGTQVKHAKLDGDKGLLVPVCVLCLSEESAKRI